MAGALLARIRRDASALRRRGKRGTADHRIECVRSRDMNQIGPISDGQIGNDPVLFFRFGSAGIVYRYCPIEWFIFDRESGEVTMRRPYKAYVSQTIGELNEKLGWMMMSAPSFKDRTGHFPERSIDTAFQGLNDSLDNLRDKLGEERYAAMRSLSDRVRAIFEVDPEGAKEETKSGYHLIHEMELMLRRKRTSS
jgi:hypothetical protein